MKASAAILFSIFFLLTTMQQTTMLLLYKLNEKSIAEKYCVNKKPGSCCHGKCHLNKALSKSENDDPKNPFSTSNIKVKETEVFYQQLHQINYPPVQMTDRGKTKYSCGLLDGFFFRHIKPPAVLG